MPLSLSTQDNHDAEPFLNRVSKTEAPDYYDSAYYILWNAVR
jgi:hypothetical protein